MKIIKIKKKLKNVRIGKEAKTENKTNGYNYEN